jgi:hypothetical protein
MLRPHWTLSLLFWMELEQRILIKFLGFRELKLLDIYYELVFTFAEEVHTLALVKHWIHELKTRRTIIASED